MHAMWQMVPVTCGMHRPSGWVMVGIQREDWLRARNAQFVGLRSICGNDCGDTCGMAHAVACKRVREWCQCSQWRMLSALTQPKRSRGKGVRGQELAGCGVRLVNVPNDVWILEALMTAMPAVLPSAPMPALTWCNDWMTSIGRRVRRSVVVGGMVDGITPSRFARGRVWLFDRAPVARFRRRAWLGGCTRCCLV